MICKDCGVTVSCYGNLTHTIDEYEHDDGSYYYSCATCLCSGHASALGSIVHWCEDLFGAFSGKPKTDVIDAAIKEVFGEQDKK